MQNSPFGHGDTSWFTQSRFGMFIHWGLYALPARHEWVKNYEEIPDETYQKYFEHFDPDLHDPQEWARLARQAGMKYVVITAKHHEGFCLWDSKYTDYKSVNTPCGRDLLRPILDAFRAEGLKVGLYYSLIDWHHPEFPVDRLHPQRNDADFAAKSKDRDVRKYAEYMRNQVRELLTEFGEIDIIWFDFSYTGKDGKGHNDWESEKLVKMIRECRPNIMINNRLDLPGVGDFVTPEQYQPTAAPVDEQGNPVVWEACQTFSGSWGYNRDEMTWKTSAQVLRMLIDGVSKGGNMLMNVGPTARGEFDYRACGMLQEIGRWMRVNGRAIYNCGPAPDGLSAPEDCRYTYNPENGRLYLHLFAWPFKAVHLPELAGRVDYVQFLHDASEIHSRDAVTGVHGGLNAATPERALTLDLPVVAPAVEIPVIELYLKK